jgi:Domain of unknown function (DUF4262)
MIMLTLVRDAVLERPAEKPVFGNGITVLEQFGFYGHATIGVADARLHFTAGMTEANLPEFFVTGNVPDAYAGGLFAAVSKEFLTTKGRTALGIRGDLMPFPIDLRLIATPLERRLPVEGGSYADMMRWLDWHWPGRVCVVQIIWPDDSGRLPDEAGFDAARCRQTVHPRLPFIAGTVPQTCASQGGNA